MQINSKHDHKGRLTSHLIQSVFENFKNDPNFKMNDILKYLNENPDVRSINEMHNKILNLEKINEFLLKK